jgi:hypothetical protein
MLGTLVDFQVAHQLTLQRSAAEHALNGLLDDALGELALHDHAGGLLLDAAGIAGVAVVDLVGVLIAREHHLVGVDDDDVVTAVDVRGVDGPVLALEAEGDESGEPTDDETLGVDQNPLLHHLGRLSDEGRHYRAPMLDRQCAQIRQRVAREAP